MVLYIQFVLMFLLFYNFDQGMSGLNIEVTIQILDH